MKVWLILASLSLASLVTAESIVLTAEERAGIPGVVILELRKVSRVGDDIEDLALRDHNVKVVLEEHDHIPGVEQWKLAFVGTEEFVSTLHVEENVGSEQEELVFDTALVSDASAVFITARDGNGTALASGSAMFKVPYIKSDVAWVGSAYDPSASSLRVDPVTLPEVLVGSHVCRQEQAPCYILREELPEVIPRCVSVIDDFTSTTYAICDDTMIPFRELPRPKDVEITSGLALQLTVPLPQDVVLENLEVVAYDPRDPSVVFSPESLECDSSVAALYPGMRCSQQLKMSKKQELVSILVVAFFGSINGSLPYSTQISYSLNFEPDVSTGVIVGSIVGGFLGLALIIGIICLVQKQRRRKSKKSSVKTSAHYTSAPTTEPAEA